MENIETIKESEFLDFYNKRTYTANCFNEYGSLNKNYNSFKSTGIIASIFEYYWEKTYTDNKDIIDMYRPNASTEIQKVIDCYNKNLGCSVYECPHCHDIVFIGHTCKSRFCSSCGYKYKNDRVESVLQTAYNCNHRQIVFTIPEQLRKYFFFPFEKRINLLFKAVKKTIYSILNESYYNWEIIILVFRGNSLITMLFLFAFKKFSWIFFLLFWVNPFQMKKIIFIKKIRMDSMFMLNLKNFLILNLVLNMLLAIVVESLLVRTELLIMMERTLLFLI